MTMTKKWLTFCLKHRDTLLLGIAMLLLLGAALQPSVPIKRNIHTYLLIADITQSMNAVDMTLDHAPASRLDYTKRMMHDIIAQLPCQTRISIGLFAGDAVAALYTPLHVCKHFSAIHQTIDHLDWRMAWTGNSQLRQSVPMTAKLLRQMPEETKAIIFTDGDEAPLLHAFNTRNLKDFQGSDDFYFVGIGTDKGTGIPKLTETNQMIGYWSNESFAVQPNIAQVTASKSSGRDDSVAVSDYDRFISRRATEYLKHLSTEIGGHYLDGDDPHAVLQKIQQHSSPRYEIIAYPIDWLLAILAGVCIISAYVNASSKRLIQQRLHKRFSSLREVQLFKSRHDITHDNHLP